MVAFILGILEEVGLLLAEAAGAIVILGWVNELLSLITKGRNDGYSGEVN